MPDTTLTDEDVVARCRLCADPLPEVVTEGLPFYLVPISEEPERRFVVFETWCPVCATLHYNLAFYRTKHLPPGVR